MALQALYKSKDDVPEALRQYYVQVGDDWVLETDEGGYKSKLNEFRGNNVNLNNRVQELADALSKLEGLDPDKHEEYRKAAEELAQIREKGLLDKAGIDKDELENLLNTRTEQMRNEFSDQIKKLSDRAETAEAQVSDLDGKLRQDRIKSVISEAITEYGVTKKGAMPMILDQAFKTWQLDNESKEPVAMRDQQKLFGENGESPLTPGEWVKSLAREMPYLFEPNAGGGARGGTGASGNGAVNTVDWNDQEALNANVDKIASGEVVVVGGPGQ